MEPRIQIKPAETSRELDHVRQLFVEYRDWLDLDWCHALFAREISALPGEYAPPSGRLYIAYANEDPAGCVALRRIDEGRCEMKRLFVRAEYRQYGLGRRLAETLICSARDLGHRKMLLDSFTHLTAAVRLYRSLGFYDIPPYNDNPEGSAIYLCLNL